MPKFREDSLVCTITVTLDVIFGGDPECDPDVACLLDDRR